MPEDAQYFSADKVIRFPLKTPWQLYTIMAFKLHSRARKKLSLSTQVVDYEAPEKAIIQAPERSIKKAPEQSIIQAPERSIIQANTGTRRPR